ncbi:MAG TPA: helix-turn-helix domain-containing protein [Chloroflexota bacterium]|nr:helix-turn-helix domain-containing protein [Chloroflexota bacterium]
MTDTTHASELMSLDAMPMLLTVKDVEAELQLGRTRTYELVRSGELPVVRIGRVVRIPRDALRQWIDERASVIAISPGWSRLER